MQSEKTIKKSALAPTALIAGGAGFIGSHLAEALLLKEARVIVLDNFRTGKDIYVNSLLTNPKFALFDVDINQGLPKEIESVDYIFHLAGVESYLYNQDNVNLDSLLTNAVGTKNLLDLAQKSSAKFLLASSIGVYQGLISPLNLDQYFGQTEEEERRYSLSEAKRFAEALVWEYYKKNQVNVRIVRLPEIYGPRMNLTSSGNLGRLLKDLLDDKNLTIFGEGVEKEHYLYISDVVAGIIKAMFNNATEGRIYTLIDKEPHAVLETTYLIKNLANREVQIEFKPKTKTEELEQKTYDLGNLKDLRWEPNISFRDGIIKTLKWFGYETNEHSFKPNKLIENKLNEKRPVTDSIFTLKTETQSAGTEAKPETLGLPKKNRIFLFLLAFILAFNLTFVCLPIIQVYFNTRNGVENLKKSPTLLAQLDSTKASDISNASFQQLNKAQKALVKLKWMFYITGKKQTYISILKLLSSMSYVSKTAYYTSKASTPFFTVWESIKPDSGKEFDEKEFSKAKLDFENAKNSLEFAKAEFAQADSNKLPSFLKVKTVYYGQTIENLSEALDVAASLSLEIPSLLGSSSPKNYLILFQNSNEIRPTGGFIGSYAVMKMEKGKIADLVIDDIYNPDGQIDLKGIKVPSPAPIASILKENNLHIRNANWNPDFAESSKVIRDLFYKSGGQSFDGVIGIDLKFAQDLLKITGPVFLTAYNEEIDEKNFYEKTQLHSDFNYTEGSDQKKSFLTLFGSKLLERVFDLPKEKMPGLINVLKDSLNQKSLLVSILDSPFGIVMDKKGWGGGLIKTDSDYLYVVNANLGGTKANYYVKNKMDYKITSQTRDGLQRAELTLTYEHTGQDSAWPGGPYTNYVRVLTQNGTRLTGVKTILNEKETDIFSKVVISKISGYSSFETNFTLQPKSTLKLVINYDLPKNLSITKSFKNYDLYWQKQPGTFDDEAAVVFTSPFGMAIESANPQTKIGERIVEYKFKLNTDKKFEVTLK